jgi:pyruvate dehydrogenase (quinone)/pyruvate oxidase
LATPGPVIVEAIVDPNEPPLPATITAKQAIHFAESLARGTPDRMKIISTVAEDTIREMI